MSTGACSVTSSSAADSVAMVASPSKNSELCAYAKRMPQVEKTGNFLQDSEAEAQRDATMACIDILIREPSHAHPTHNFLQRRITEVARAGAVNTDEEFSGVTTMQRLDKGWVLNFLVRISDIPLNALVKAVAFDGEAHVQLLVFALVYGSNLKIPPQAVVKEVLWRAFLARDNAVGKRLRSWSANGGIGKDFRINWKKGVYKLVWCEEGKILRKIEHVSGDTVEVTGGLVVTPSWNLLENWSDYTASLQLKPHAPMRLHKFFEGTNKGPFDITPCTGQSKLFEREITIISEQVQKEKEDRDDGKTTDTATAELAKVEGSRKAAALDKARAAAKTAIATKKARRTLTLEKSLQ